jgi:hypothetical protein
MTKTQLTSLAREHALNNVGLATIVVRCALYLSIQVSSACMAHKWFSESFQASSCIFLILIICFELAWSLTHATGRRIGYLLAVAGLLGSGLILLQQAASISEAAASTQHLSHIRTMRHFD